MPPRNRSGRWFLTIIDVPSVSAIGDTPNRILIAVSDAASAGAVSAGTVWTFFFVQQNTVGGGGSGEFLDYPSLGIDNNALYIGGNMFDAATGDFLTTSAFVVRKSSVLGAGPVVTTAFRQLILDPNNFDEGPLSPRGVDNYNPTATEGYFIGQSDQLFGELVIRRVSNPGGTPTISADILLSVPATSFPNTVPHLGNANLADTDLDGFPDGNLDALDDRLYAAHIRNGKLWTAHNIKVTTAGTTNGATGTRDAVRWYELNVPVGSGAPTLVQSGTIFDSAATATARHFWIPSVMVSGQGHAAIGYSTAGNTFHADAATSGRLRTDTLGTTGAVNIYTATTGNYNPLDDTGPPARRWGDYSFTSLDPQDDMTMWTVQEFCDANNSYGVRVAKLIAPPPAAPNSASPTTTANWGTSTRFDAVGFSAITGTTLFTEGTALSPASGITTNNEYSFVRRANTASGGLPQDTDSNQADFDFVSTTGGTFSTRVSILGAPGPENLASPINRNAQFATNLLDTTKGSTVSPNRERDMIAGAVGPNSAASTLTIRRAVTNNSGATTTRLRFRIIDITTLNSPVVMGGQAQVRALNSGSATVTVNGVPTTVEGTTVETPPTQASGGGLNSSMGRSLVAGTIINTPIAPGQTINVQFVLGVQVTGNFRFFVNIEALP